jgi:mannobiose 2-epimerase
MSSEEKVVKQLKKEIVQDLTENILPFWAKFAPDTIKGGFYGMLNYDGSPVADAEKGGILNARLLWTFSSAYRILNDADYKILADRAQRYFIDYFIDKEYNGSYYTLNADGLPLDTEKVVYQNAFAVYALSEHYRATGNEESLSEAVAIYKKLVEYAYDSINGGFVESFTRDWQMVSSPFPKTMDNNLHVLESFTNLYRVWKDEGLKKMLKQQIDIMSNKILDRTTWHEQLYFTMDWRSQVEAYSNSHDIESSWLLVEAAEVLGDAKILGDARNIAVNLATAQLKQGVDARGAIIGDKLDGNADNYIWWPQAEAFTGFLNAWQISKDKKFLDAAVYLWDWIKDYLIDREYGEWYKIVHADGTPEKEAAKAGQWRCPYHNSRMGFEIMTRFP